MSTVITDNLYHGSGKVNMIMLNGERIYQGVTKPAPEPEYDKMYFTFEALENGSFGFRNWEHSTKSYSYSVNNSEWVIASGLNTIINLNIGDTVRFKSTDDISGLFDAAFSIDFKIYGNILSVKYGDNFVGAEGHTPFRFVDTKVVDASNLVLPTNDIDFNNMFKNCKKLLKAPELPVETLTNNCYRDMFSGCTSLNYIRCLATDLSAPDCLSSWVENVSPTGTFVKKAGVTWPTGANGIPSGWTVIEE